MLEESIRDKLNSGIGYQHVQRILPAESKLTLDPAVEIAMAMEAAESARCFSTYNTLC